MTKIVNALLDLGFCPETLEFVNMEIEKRKFFNYHCDDLLALGPGINFRTWSVEQQISLVRAVMENRKKMEKMNKLALARILLARAPDSQLAGIWFEELMGKITEIMELCHHTSPAVSFLDHNKKGQLKLALAGLSVKNLDALIKTRSSMIKEKSPNDISVIP